MLEGCSLKDCKVCKDDSIKCSRKGVVYKAECAVCDEKIRTLRKDNKLDQTMLEHLSKGCYVGETSRVLRLRVQEHYENLGRWNQDSFMLEHWALNHGLDLTPPQFKFSVLSSHKDALSRQLMEAIIIKEQGKLNKKQEYSSNKIIRMETHKYSWELEVERSEETKLKQNKKEKICCFINVMKNLTLSVLKNSFSRSKRQKSKPLSLGKSKRIKMMQTSTPISDRREPQPVIDSDDSGTRDLTGDSNDSKCSMNISNINGGDVEKEKTEPDIKMRTFNIKTPSPESKELQIAKNIITAEDFYDSERPKLNRTTSANNISCASVQQEGELTVRDRSISTSLQDIDFEKWDTDKKFKRYDSEESSMDYDNKEYFEEKKTTVVNNLIEEDSLKSNLIDEDRLKSNLFEEDKPKSNLFLEQKVVDDTIKGREANLVNDSVNLVNDSVNEQEHFEEQDVDWNEVNPILVEKRENKVYKIL